MGMGVKAERMKDMNHNTNLNSYSNLNRGIFYDTENMPQPSLTQDMVNKLYMEYICNANHTSMELAVMQNQMQNQINLLRERSFEAEELQKMKHDADIELEKMKQEHQEKMLKLKEAQAEGMLRKTLEYQNASSAIVADSQGFLCVETRLPDNKKEVSAPVLLIADLSMIRMIDCETHEPVADKLVWDHGEKSFLLKKSKNKAIEFSKKLEEYGETIAVSSKRKSMVATMIYAYLIKHAKYDEVYSHWGWNKTDKGWIFVFDEPTEDDMKGVKTYD